MKVLLKTLFFKSSTTAGRITANLLPLVAVQMEGAVFYSEATILIYFKMLKQADGSLGPVKARGSIKGGFDPHGPQQNLQQTDSTARSCIFQKLFQHLFWPQGSLAAPPGNGALMWRFEIKHFCESNLSTKLLLSTLQMIVGREKKCKEAGSRQTSGRTVHCRCPHCLLGCFCKQQRICSEPLVLFCLGVNKHIQTCSDALIICSQYTAIFQ